MILKIRDSVDSDPWFFLTFLLILSQFAKPNFNQSTEQFRICCICGHRFILYIHLHFFIQKSIQCFFLSRVLSFGIGSQNYIGDHPGGRLHVQQILWN